MRLQLEVAEELFGEVVHRQSKSSVKVCREYHIFPFFGMWVNLSFGWHSRQHPFRDPSAPSQVINVGLFDIRALPGAPWQPSLPLFSLGCQPLLFLDSLFLIFGIRGIPDDVDWGNFL